MKNKCLDTIFKLLNSAKSTESLNSVMFLLSDVFTERIDDAISIFDKIIESDEITSQIYSFIGTNMFHQFKDLLELRPEFIDSIYKNYFGYIRSNGNGIIIEEPNDKYKQLFDEYFIYHVTTNYLEVRKLEGIKVLIGCINFDNYKKHIKSSKSELKDERIEQALNRVTSLPFKFQKNGICFYEDMSDLWDNFSPGYDTLLDNLFKYIDKYIETNGDGEIIELFKSEKMVGQIWLRFIDFMLKNKDKYLEELTDLAVKQTSLKFSLTLFKKMGIVLGEIVQYFNEEQKRYLEKELYELFDGKRKIWHFSPEAVQLRTRRYIDLLGENLILPETKAIYQKDEREGKEPHKIFSEESVKVEFKSCSVDYDTFRYGDLKDDVQIEFAKHLKTLKKFYYDNLNNKPEDAAIQNVLSEIKDTVEIYDKQKESLTEPLKNDYYIDLSLVLTKICSNLLHVGEDDKNYIKFLFLELLKVDINSVEDYSDVDTLFYLNNPTPKSKIAQAIVLFLQSEKDQELYGCLLQLVKIQDSSLVLFDILSGLFPKGEVFKNTEENWNLLTLLTENIIENYKDYNELKTALYYYVLYAALFKPDKSKEIIERLECSGEPDVYFKNSIYNVLYYYFDHRYVAIDWIKERQEKLINTYNPQIYEKILHLIGTEMVYSKDIVKTILSNILIQENFLSSLEQNKECLKVFLNQLTYKDNNHNVIKEFLPVLSTLVKLVLKQETDEGNFRRLVNKIIELLILIEPCESSEILIMFEILIDFLNKSDVNPNNYDLYLRLNKVIDFLQKMSEKDKFSIIKNDDNLLIRYGEIINKITLFSWHTKCMNFIWNLNC